MSTVQKKTVLERITINNILAFMVIGTYCGIWAFAIFTGIMEVVNPTQEQGDPVLVVLTTIESFATVISTMTIIVVLVIQYHFRTSPSQ
jgi:Na+/H+-dicarboxylate symporter